MHTAEQGKKRSHVNLLFISKYKRLQRFWKGRSICQCLSEPPCTALLICLYSEPMQECQACNKFHTFTAWMYSCRDLWETTQTRRSGAAQQHTPCSGTTPMRHKRWVHRLEKEEMNPLINLFCAYSTEDGLAPVLRHATVNGRWKYSASSRKYSTSLCITA